MRSFRFLLLLGILLCTNQSRGDDCATHRSELDKTPRLHAILQMFNQSAGSAVGLVNGTQGSYVILDSKNDELTIAFYTSGLFDLFPIKRDGPLKFCDTGKVLRMIGLDRDEELVLPDGKFVLGEGGPKRTFTVGLMPVMLKQLHHMEDVPAASHEERAVANQSVDRAVERGADRSLERAVTQIPLKNGK
jgi:hypothetical protein